VGTCLGSEGQIRDTRGVILPSGAPSCFAQARVACELAHKLFRRARKKNLASGEVSRCNQFLSKMIIAFENVKHIYQYRTPRTLKAYSNTFIILLPILYGPYFAAISTDFARGLQYLLPVLFTVILVSLDNIQEHLENPFDQVGEDDVVINAEKFVARLGSG